MNASHRPFHRWLIALLIFCIGISVSGRTSAEAQTAADQLRSAWRSAQSAESYRAISDVEMQFLPLSDAETLTRIDWRIESAFQQPDAVQMTLQAEGEAFSSRALELIAVAGNTYLKEGDHYNPISNPAGLVMPNGDLLTFIVAASDEQRIEETPTWQKIAFEIDGAAYVAHVALGGTSAEIYDGMSGNGELWIDADGLPLRQKATLNLPNAGEGVTATIQMTTDFFDYGTVAPFAIPVERSDGTFGLPEVENATFAPLQLAAQVDGDQLLATLIVLSGGLLLATVLLFWRRHGVYRLITFVLVCQMVSAPLIQMVGGQQMVRRAEAAGERQQAEAQATFDRALGIDVAQMQQEAQAAIAAEAGLTTGDITQCNDPHARDSNDTDHDGLDDLLESCIGTSVFSADSDGDGISDRVELEGFDYQGTHWTSDPFKLDSNGDGRADFEEWFGDTGMPSSVSGNPNLTGLASNIDFDNDGTPNIWDDDDDGDGVPDLIDLSPEVVSQSYDDFALTLATGGQKSTVYIDLQLRPTDTSHLRYSVGALDWPYDELGNMRDLDDSRNDIRLIPLVEIETNIKPDSDIAREYHVTAAGKLYTPLTPDALGGNIAAYRTRIAYNVLPNSGDIEWRSVRMVWVAQAIVDSFINCNDPSEPSVNSCEIDSRGGIVNSYEETFKITGLRVERQDGFESILLGTPTTPNNDATLFRIAFALNNSFLKHNTLQNVAGGTTALDEFAKRFNATTGNIPEQYTYGVTETVPVFYRQFDHSDEGVADLSNTQVTDYLAQYYDNSRFADPALRGRAADGSTFKVASLLTAWESTSANYDLSEFSAETTCPQTDQFVVCLNALTPITQRGARIEMYQSTGLAEDWEAVDTARLLEILYARYPDAALDASAVALVNSFAAAGKTITETPSTQEMRVQLLAAYGSWRAGITRISEIDGIGNNMQPTAQTDDLSLEETDGSALASTGRLKATGLLLTDLAAMLEGLDFLQSATRVSHSFGVNAFFLFPLKSLTAVKGVGLYAGTVAFTIAAAVCQAEETCNDQALAYASVAFDGIVATATTIDLIKTLLEVASKTAQATKVANVVAVANVIIAAVGLGLAWASFGMSISGANVTSAMFALALTTAIIATVYAVILVVLLFLGPIGVIVGAILGLAEIFLGLIFGSSVVATVTSLFISVHTLSSVGEVDFGSPESRLISQGKPGFIVGNAYETASQFTGTITGRQHYKSTLQNSFVRGWMTVDVPSAAAADLPETVTPSPNAFTLTGTNAELAAQASQCLEYGVDTIQCRNAYRLSIGFNESGINRVAATDTYIQAKTYYERCALFGNVCGRPESALSSSEGNDPNYLYFDIFPNDIEALWQMDGTTLRVYSVDPASSIYGYNFDAVGWDIDGDGVTFDYEQLLGTDPDNPDSDDDGLNDGDELRWGTDPTNPDSDNDGLLDGAEVFHFDGTTWTGGWVLAGLALPSGRTPRLFGDPLSADIDADDVLDGQERAKQSSPYAFDSGQPHVRLNFNDDRHISPDGQESVVVAANGSTSAEIVLENTTSQQLGGSMVICPPQGVTLSAGNLSGDRSYTAEAEGDCTKWTLNPPLPRGGAVAGTLNATVDGASGSVAFTVQLNASANFRVLLPLYIYPTVGDNWQRVADANSETPVTAIINPSSGPIDPNDPSPAPAIYSDYTNGMNLLAAANVEMIGYVASSYGNFDLADLKQQIDLYETHYPHITGIFVDEAASNPSANDLDDYIALHDYIKSKPRFNLVVLNTGLNASEDYFIEDAADVIVMFEDVASAWQSYTPVSFFGRYSKNRFAALVHTQPNESGMTADIDIAAGFNIGYIYVTNDDCVPCETTGNPWDSLPTYWDAMIDYMAQLNNSSVPLEFTQTVIVDGDLPTIAIDSSETPFATGSSLVIAGTASDQSSWVEKVQVSIDNGAYVDATGTHRWSFTQPLGASNGTLLVQVRAIDALGQVSAFNGRTFIVDQTVPTVTLDQGSIEVAHSRVITLTGSAADTPLAPQRVQVSIDGAPWEAATIECPSCVGTTRNWHYRWVLPSTAHGSYDIAVRAFDGANHPSALAETSLLVDNDAPTSTLLEPLTSADFPVVSASNEVLEGYANDAGRILPPPRPHPLTGELDAYDAATVYLSPDAPFADLLDVVTIAEYQATWVGDMNGDGRADLAVALPFSDNFAGEVAILFGKVGGFTLPPDYAYLRDADGRFRGGEQSFVDRIQITALGDVDGDGLSDLGIIHFGQLFVIFGQTTPYGDNVLRAPNAWTADDFDSGQYRAATVELPSNSAPLDFAAAGDINGDGYDDILVESAERFRILTLRGRSERTDGVLHTELLATIPNSNPEANSGSGVGDVTGDGIDDFALGSAVGVHLFAGDANYTGTPYSFVQTFGGHSIAQDDSTPLTLDAATALISAAANDLTALGNVNGDGFADFAFIDENGTPRLVLGRTPSNLQPETWSADVALTYDPPATRFIAAPGDVNADGIDDILLGYSGQTVEQNGAYLLHGHTNIAQTGTRIAANLQRVGGAADAPYAAGADLNCDLSSDLLLIPAAAGVFADTRDVGAGVNVNVLHTVQSAAPAPLAPTTPNRSLASTLWVDDDNNCQGNNPCYATIQEAINAAPDDSTIHVLPGVYPPFAIDGKNGLTIEGVDADAVFVDGGGSADGVTFSNLNDVTLRKVTIRNVQNGVVLNAVGVGSGNEAKLSEIVIHDFQHAVEMDRQSFLAIDNSTIAGDHDSATYFNVVGAVTDLATPLWTAMPDLPSAPTLNSHFFGSQFIELVCDSFCSPAGSTESPYNQLGYYADSTAHNIYRLRLENGTWEPVPPDGTASNAAVLPAYFYEINDNLNLIPPVALYNLRDQSPAYFNLSFTNSWSAEDAFGPGAMARVPASALNGKSRVVTLYDAATGTDQAYVFAAGLPHMLYSADVLSNAPDSFAARPLPIANPIGDAFDVELIGNIIYLLDGTTLYRYDIAANSWQTLGSGPFPTPRFGLSLTAVAGTAYLLAAQPGSVQGQDEFALYDVAGGYWVGLPATLPNRLGGGSRGVHLQGGMSYTDANGVEQTTLPQTILIEGLGTGMHRFNLSALPPAKLRLDTVAMLGAQNNDATAWLNSDLLIGNALPYDFALSVENTQWVSPNWTPQPAGVTITPFDVDQLGFTAVAADVYSVVAGSPLTTGYKQHAVRDVHVYATQSACEADRCTASGANQRVWGVTAFGNLHDALATTAPQIVVHPGQYQVSGQSLALNAGQEVIGVDKQGVILILDAGLAILFSAEGTPAVTLKNLTLRGNDHGTLVQVDGDGTLDAQRLLAKESASAFAVAGENAHIALANLTLANNDSGVVASDCAGFDIRNTLFMHHAAQALAWEMCANQALHTYNAFWNGGNDFEIDGATVHAPGSGELFQNPYIDLTTLWPLSVSPLIDAGDPRDPIPPSAGDQIDIGYHEGGQSILMVDDDYCATCNNDGLTWGVDAFSDIQAGVDAAAAYVANLQNTADQSVGQVSVGVAPGDYTGTVTINSSHIALIGSGYDTRLFGSPNRSNIELVGSTSLQNITIRGLHLAAGAASLHGIESRVSFGHDIMIERNLIVGQAGDGLHFAGYGQVESVIRFNTIAHQQGYLLQAPGVYQTVSNNILLGSAETDAIFKLNINQLNGSHNLGFGAPELAGTNGTLGIFSLRSEPTIDEKFQPTFDSIVVDAADPYAELVAGGGLRADIGYYEYQIPPFLLLFGKQGDNSCAVANSGVGAVEVALTAVTDSEQTVEDFLPIAWQNATLDRSDETGAYWQMTLPALNSGLYAVFSRATDQLSTQENDPVDWFEGQLIVDNDAPQVQLYQSEYLFFNSGVRMKGFASDSPSFSGQQGDTLADVYFEVDGQRVEATYHKSALGQHEFHTVVGLVGGGTRSVQAVAVDLAGNVAKSSVITVNGAGGGRSAAATAGAALEVTTMRVNTTTVSVDGFALFESDTGNDGRVQVRVVGGVAQAVTLASAETLTRWSAEITLPTAADHDVEVLLDGNVVDSGQIIYDDTPPLLSIDNLNDGAVVSETLTVIGTTELSATVDFSVDGGATWSAVAVTDTAWQTTWRAPSERRNLPVLLTLRAFDLAGNQAIVTRTVRVNSAESTVVDVRFSQPQGSHFDGSGSLVISYTSPFDPFDEIDVRLLASQNMVETLTASHSVGGASQTVTFGQNGAWYVHLGTDAGSAERYGPWYVGNFGCAAATQSIVLDGYLNISGGEWRRDNEWLDDDERAVLQPDLYATWVADTFYVGYQNGYWDTAGDLWLYFDSASGGTTQVVTVGELLPFSADLAIQISSSQSASVYEWNGAAWQSVTRPDFQFAHVANGTELAIPLSVGGGIEMVAFATDNSDVVAALFPTTNPLSGQWTDSYTWASPCDVNEVNAGQPQALNLAVTLTSPQARNGQWGAGQTLNYLLTVQNNEASRTAQGVSAILSSSDGLTLNGSPTIALPDLVAGERYTQTVLGILAADLSGINSVSATAVVAGQTVSAVHTIDNRPPVLSHVGGMLWARPNTTFTVRGTANDGGGSGTANVSSDVGSISGTRNWTASVPIGTAPMTIHLTATDVHGNTSAPFAVPIGVDADAPQIDFAITGDLTDTLKLVNGQATDATSGIVAIEVQFEEDGGWFLVNLFDATSGNWTFRWDTSSAESTPRIRARATDKAGNQTLSDWKEAILQPPGGIADLSLWLSANIGVRASSGAVSQWDDLSGLNRHALQSTASMQPTLVSNALNGLPVMRFDGTNDFLELADAAIDGATEFTFVVVFDRQGNTGPWQRLWEFGDGGNQRFGYLTPENGAGSQQFTLYDLVGGATTEVHASALNATGAQLLTLHWPTSGSGTIFTNGNATGTGPVYLSPATLGDINFHVLGKAVGGFDNFAGDIAEVILFPTALSELERTQVELYLADKYALDWAGTTLYGDAMHAQQVRGISRQAGIGSSADSGGLSINDQTFLQDDDDLILFGHDGGDDITNADVPAPATWRVVREWRIVPNDDGANGGQITLTFDLAALGISGTVFPADDYFLLTRSSGGRAPFGVVSADQVSIDGTNVNFTVDTAALDNLVTLATREEPTAITLDSFTTQQTDDGTVLVEWVTEAEFDLAGFNLYRTATAQFVDDGAINGLLLPSTGLQGQGDSYSFEETDVPSGTWYYWLEDVDIHGERTLHGPVEQVVTEPTVVGLRGAVALSHSLLMMAFVSIGLLTVGILLSKKRRE